MIHDKVRIDNTTFIPMLAYAFFQGTLRVLAVRSITTNLRTSEFIKNIIPIDSFSPRSVRE